MAEEDLFATLRVQSIVTGFVMEYIDKEVTRAKQWEHISSIGAGWVTEQKTSIHFTSF